ncbi:MAG TPA: adenosine kinase [Alphaproteobacteria bacterium]|nr:adenosine kinase [Alphaproteobacteria bacterium]HBC55220.1 adenosine kinase [Alphaproteobacteria bacterium]HCO90020.1 adenosine kinase [Alphaproteobacteria bacterium]
MANPGGNGATFDILGIGNAIVDVIAHADDRFLTDRGITKGGMTLIDADGATSLYGDMAPGIEMSGGSAANTIAGAASLGARAAYIGKVRNDQLGEVFAHDIRAIGVHYDTPLAETGPPTARCLILVTPDAQRSMNTFLGASQELGPDDVDAALVAAATITYLEGYLWDPVHAKAAFRKAMDIAHGAGRQVAMTLSDSFCVDRYRQEFRELVDHQIDILFANEDEIKSLYEVDDFDDALQAVRGKCDIVALTRSEKGSVILTGDEVHVIDAAPVAKVVDTTGAGDLFAAGFLYGITNGLGPAESAGIGGRAAAEVISHMGARPEIDLKTLL